MKTLHIVSHTHWDREWFETFQQFRLKLVRMVDDLLDLLENDPTYRHFMLDGQMIVLEDYLAIRPEREEDLRKHIQEGRILVGPWYILPDEFLVSPEATVRNLIEGDRIAGRFGSKMHIGYLPDTFGHIGQMPQILRGYGFDKACVWRGVGDLPCEFWWEAPDGSKVLMGFLRQSYSNARHLTGVSTDRFVEDVKSIHDSLTPHIGSSHLLLMNGDDFMTPQPMLGKAIQAAQDALEGIALLHSTLPAYFAGLEAAIDLTTLPVAQGELRSTRLSNLLPNVLSTRIWIKQRNHACETLLEKWAEPFSTWAGALANSSPSSTLLNNPNAPLRHAWRLLMQSHPHDSICGCSIDQVHTEMRPRFDQVEQIGEEITSQSLQVICDTVNTSTHLPNVVSAALVFNPTSSVHTDAVNAALQGLKPGVPFRLLDEDGKAIPYEIMRWEREEMSSMTLPPEEVPNLLGEVFNGEIQGFRILATDVQHAGTEAHIELVISDHGRPDLPAWEKGLRQIEDLLADGQVQTYDIEAIKPIQTHVAFTLANVPPHGYKTIWVQAGYGEIKEPLGVETSEIEPLSLANDETGTLAAIENEFLSVALCPDGTLNLTDRRTDVVYRGLNRFLDSGDRGDEYSFSPSEDCKLYQPKLVRAGIQRCSAWQSLEVELELVIPARIADDRIARSAEMITLPIKTRARLFSGVPRLEFHTEVDNQAEDHRLRAHFPAPIRCDSALHDGHFEIVRRPIGVPEGEDWFEQPRPEVPQRAFTAIEDGKIGLLVANRGLPEVEVLQTEEGGSEIALTLLRCVGWLSRGDFPERGGHAGPGLPTPEAQMKGTWSFDYAVVPFAKSDILAAYQQAYAFQTPLRAASTGLHAGPLPASASFLQVEHPGFVISAMKTAEDGNGWIARGYNLSAESLEVTLRPLLPFSKAEKVNLAEKPIVPLSVEDDRSIRLPVRGREIISVRFK